jgi:hypothetical protein
MMVGSAGSVKALAERRRESAPAADQREAEQRERRPGEAARVAPLARAGLAA